ncbi:MAG: hypothetical protein NXY57DRAFT_1042897 [Lentinula lateritia]|nr:MAG: hypothetical protein NXY57DRAFT_1042897 [Lentinula lateritia]
MYFHRIMISALGFISVVQAAAVPGPTPVTATTVSYDEDFILARPLSSRASKLASVLFHGKDPSTPSIQADTETAVFRLLQRTLEHHPEFGHSLTREEVEFKGSVVKGKSGEYRFDVTLKDSSGTEVACRGHVIYRMESTTIMQIQQGSAVYRVSDFEYLSKIERPYVEVLGGEHHASRRPAYDVTLPPSERYLPLYEAKQRIALDRFSFLHSEVLSEVWVYKSFKGEGCAQRQFHGKSRKHLNRRRHRRKEGGKWGGRGEEGKEHSGREAADLKEDVTLNVPLGVVAVASEKKRRRG